MPLRQLALMLMAILLLGEAAVAVWRLAPIPASTAPVFSFPPAAADFHKPGNIAFATEHYGADRGAQWNGSAADGTRLTAFYFEWDRVEVGPILSMAGHAPDLCNVGAGFKLKAILPKRCHEIEGQNPLVFDCTHFTDPAGRNVFMFKMPWIQGIGSLPMRMEFKRMTRLGRSLERHIGAGRVLYAGVFDAPDADQAWETFHSEVLERLEWQ